MSETNKSWNNVSKRKKKHPYVKKQDRKENSNNNLRLTSNNDFPFLSSKVPSRQTDQFENSRNLYDALGWKKPTSPKILDNIYSKAKKGMDILNEYPIFYESPTIPLFH
jgi:hypothetical protein